MLTLPGRQETPQSLQNLKIHLCGVKFSPPPFKALGSGISLIIYICANWGSRKTRFKCVKKKKKVMMCHVKEKPKIVALDPVCMQSNVGQRCDWCLLSSLTTEMEINVLLYTERLSKKGGPGDETASSSLQQRRSPRLRKCETIADKMLSTEAFYQAFICVVTQ